MAPGTRFGIQGAVFEVADAASQMGLAADFTGTKACMVGSAAQVDLACIPKPPASDCYGEFWGAAIEINLNQPLDPTTKMATSALPFDASTLSGFAFDIMGAKVPPQMRFQVDDANGRQFCSPANKPRLASAANTFTFADLLEILLAANGPASTAETATAKGALMRIDWQVVTNPNAPVPFDFCVSNIRAIPNTGAVPQPAPP